MQKHSLSNILNIIIQPPPQTHIKLKKND